MNSRTLTTLSAVALFIIVIAVWMGQSRSPHGTEQKNLYPALKGNLGNVTGISLFKAGDQLAVDISREGDNWIVKQRHNYRADSTKVNALLIALEGATLREQKTANPANYSSLGVQDVADAAASGVRVELAGTTSPVKLIIGKHDGGTHSTYVRRAGEQESWLIGGDLEVAADPTQWLKRDLVSIGADRVQGVDVQIGGASYSAFKSTRADPNFDVKGIPKGRELNSVSVANSVAQALNSLQLDDVRPAAELSDQKSVARTVFSTFDGLVVECSGYQVGEQRWITLKTRANAELAKRFHVASEPAKEPKDKQWEDSFQAESKAVEAEALALNTATSQWAYALPAYKYDAIFKPLEDLLKKTEMLKKK